MLFDIEQPSPPFSPAFPPSRCSRVLLYIQVPLGSAGNKGLITPLESALTENSPVSSLESALTKRWGLGVRGIPVRILDSGEVLWTSAPENSALSAVRACSEHVEMLIPFPSLNLQLSIEDPDHAENFNLFTKLSFRHSRTSLQMPVYHRPGGIQSCPTATGVSSTSRGKRCGVSKSRFSLPPHCFSSQPAPGPKPAMLRQVPLSQLYPRSRTAGCTCASSVRTPAARRCASTSLSNWRKKFFPRSTTTASTTERSRSTAPTPTTWTSMPSWTPSAPPRTANTSPCRAATLTCASPRRAIT